MVPGMNAGATGINDKLDYIKGKTLILNMKVERLKPFNSYYKQPMNMNDNPIDWKNCWRHGEVLTI